MEAIEEHIEVLERLSFVSKSDFVIEQLDENNIIIKVMNYPHRIACEEIVKGRA